jgi:hypothetical protein
MTASSTPATLASIFARIEEMRLQWPRLIQAGIHARGDLHPAGQSQPDVHTVPHPVGVEGAPNLADDLLFGGNVCKGQRQRRTAQPGQVLAEYEFEDTSIVDAQLFPDRVAALHDGIERADARLIAVEMFRGPDHAAIRSGLPIMRRRLSVVAEPQGGLAGRGFG